MKKLITFALSLLMTISLCTTLTADENTNTSSSLAFDRVAVGNLSSGYTVGVTVPTYIDENGALKPFSVYLLSFTGNENISYYPCTWPGLGETKGGNFSEDVFRKDDSSFSFSMIYTANDDATVEQVEKDLSSITYKGEGTITISVMKDTNTVYYNGHYYKLTSTYTSWQAAMSEMLKGDTESYKGYKGHPVTITSVDENEVIQNFQKKQSSTRIWLGGITSTATKDNSYTDGKLNNVPGGDGTVATAGKGTGYKWIWGTPEGDSDNQDKNVLPDEPDNTAASATVTNKTTYWYDGEPNANTGYAIYMGLGNSPYWDDLSLNDLTNSGFSTACYVTEYSPIDADGNWLYDEDGNSATSGFENAQIVSKTITSNDVYKHNNFDTNWSYDETYHWHKCLEEDCTEIIDKSEHLGGNATCISKAICETCGKEYGEINPNNHSNLIHVEATDPSATGYGNIEYWYCKGCNKYFSDKDATKEITKDSTLIIKSFDSRDKNHDRVISCDEEMNSANWVWSETKKACVYKVSNTSAK